MGNVKSNSNDSQYNNQQKKHLKRQQQIRQQEQQLHQQQEQIRLQQELLLKQEQQLELLNVASNKSQNNDFVYRDDDNESVLSKDEDKEVRTRVSFNGLRKQGVSEFSRLDLFCKKSILLHEIGFTTDLSKHGEEIRLSISIFEGNRRSDIHSRTIKNDRRGMKINYIKFTRTPLKFYIGQKFFIKVNFVGPVSILHVAGDKFSHSDIFETRKDVQKNYLNCVSYLIISDMPRK